MIRFIVRIYHPNTSARNLTEQECFNPDVLLQKIEQARIELLENECARTGYNLQELMDVGYTTRVFIETGDSVTSDKVPSVPNTSTEESNDSKGQLQG